MSRKINTLPNVKERLFFFGFSYFFYIRPRQRGTLLSQKRHWALQHNPFECLQGSHVFYFGKGIFKIVSDPSSLIVDKCRGGMSVMKCYFRGLGNCTFLSGKPNLAEDLTIKTDEFWIQNEMTVWIQKWSTSYDWTSICLFRTRCGLPMQGQNRMCSESAAIYSHRIIWSW